MNLFRKLIFTGKNWLPQSIKNLYHAVSATLAVFWYGFPARRLCVIGVTGTDGKTTTSTLIYHLLKTAGFPTALISTVAAYIGEETIDTGFHTTSPNEWALQKLIKKAAHKGIKYLVLESTSIGLDQHRLLGTNVKYAVYTNLTHEHLDYHGTMAKYLAAKSRLVKNAKIIVINRDDPELSKVVQISPPNARLLTYSPGGKMLTGIKNAFKESHNRANALAAVTLVQALGLTNDQINHSFASFPGIPGRMESIVNQRGLRIIVDFAHTPNAIQAVLTTLKKKSGRLITVFGATGRRDHLKRPKMGDIASRLADEVVLTADDTYGENIDTIIRQIKAGIVVNHGHVHAVPDRYQAIKFALNTLARNGDTVAILGQGHEQSINLDGRTEIPWSDQHVVQEILKKTNAAKIVMSK